MSCDSLEPGGGGGGGSCDSLEPGGCHVTHWNLRGGGVI